MCIISPPLYSQLLLSTSWSTTRASESSTSSAITSTEFKVSLRSSTNFRFLITSSRWASLSVLSTVSGTSSSGCSSWSILEIQHQLQISYHQLQVGQPFCTQHGQWHQQLWVLLLVHPWVSWVWGLLCESVS